MSEWKLKRFWKTAAPMEREDGFAIGLDGRGVKTPAKSELMVPTKALAQAISEEWDAQTEAVDPESMPLTRLANSALDKVTSQFDEVAAHLTEYGGSDLLCYRADGPEELICRQSEIWGGLLDWARTSVGVELIVQSGLMPVDQPKESLSVMAGITADFTPFELTAFHEFVTLSGSWVIGYAAFKKAQPVETLWECALLDELWQEEQWGEDEEAIETRAIKRQAFLTAAQFLDLCHTS